MIPLSLLLLAAAFAAGGLAWLVREITRADRQRIAQAWEHLADVQRHVDDAREVIAEQQARLATDDEWLDAPTLGERVVEPLYYRQLEEMFAAPAADVREDGQEVRRRGER